MSNLPPVLLTSSVVAMDTSVNLKDEKLRIFHTLESIEKWLDISPKNKYVLCDGSGFDFSSLVLDCFPDAEIECIFFDNDPALIKEHGKGYGEGEIIRYALEHSKTLKQSQWFAKCTAKLWVDNFLQCTQEWNEKFLCQAFFSDVFSIKTTQIKYLDTRFYLVNKSFYQAHFSDAHADVGGIEGVSIENKFLDIAVHERLNHFIFSVPPVICGVGGGSGKYYKCSKIRRLKEKVRLWLVSCNPKFGILFNKY